MEVKLAAVLSVGIQDANGNELANFPGGDNPQPSVEAGSRAGVGNQIGIEVLPTRSSILAEPHIDGLPDAGTDLERVGTSSLRTELTNVLDDAVIDASSSIGAVNDGMLGRAGPLNAQRLGQAGEPGTLAVESDIWLEVEDGPVPIRVCGTEGDGAGDGYGIPHRAGQLVVGPLETVDAISKAIVVAGVVDWGGSKS